VAGPGKQMTSEYDWAHHSRLVVMAWPEVAPASSGGEVVAARPLRLGFRQGSRWGGSMHDGGSLSRIQGRARKPWPAAGTSGGGSSPAAAAMAGGGWRAHARELRRWLFIAEARAGASLFRG
jgi:hypothetical protein